MIKNIIITGGAGFIGINLINYIFNKNPESNIIIIDNHTCSNIFFNEILNKLKKIYKEKIIFFNMDICDKELLNILLYHNIHIHQIYHLASIASPIIYKQKPFETLDTSYNGSKNIFEIAKHFNSIVLIASTSEIYGDPNNSPQNESYFGNVNCFGHRSCYDEGKRIMETLAFEYIRNFNLDIRIARIFNTYGPYMNLNDGRIIPSLIDSFLLKKPIQIFNGGKQTRCFNYIDDTLNGLYNLMENKNKINIPVNIGNDNEYNIIDTYYNIKSIFEKYYPNYDTNLPIIEGFSDENDPKIRKPDLTRAKELLDYQIKTNFEDGIRKTIDYFINFYQKSNQN